MKSGWVLRPGAAEFPHENGLVDRGALWIGDGLCGAERAILSPRVAAERAGDAPPSSCEEQPVAAAAPVSREQSPNGATSPPQVTARPPAEPSPGPAASRSGTEAPPVDERVEQFVRTIAEVAVSHGAAEAAAHVESLLKFGTPAPLELSTEAERALLEGNIVEATETGFHATAWFTETSSAWQSILRGEPGNLAVCGESTLDSWTADLIARLVAKPGMASTIRRDLRRRGIAAFGMLDA